MPDVGCPWKDGICKGSAAAGNDRSSFERVAQGGESVVDYCEDIQGYVRGVHHACAVSTVT